jgi:hypothetical protein
MFLGHNASWWGVVLSIAGLVLMVPAGFIVNIFTPVLLNKLAELTDASLNKRIEKLEANLADLEMNHPLMTLTEHHIVFGILGTLQLLSYGLKVFGIVLIVTAIEPNSPTWGLTRHFYELMWIMVGLGLQFLPYAWRKAVVKNLEVYQQNHSPIFRERLRKSICELRAIREK